LPSAAAMAAEQVMIALGLLAELAPPPNIATA